jgi:spore germination cell wall hydrolase CwlJ-like protein|tara:strand:- start:1312 stop:1752 length:441 start_codon:yes stop_codon:yes gene_type:complete
MLLETAFICLALNTYHEAKNQSMIGQIAVAEVVMNRVQDKRFPNSVCEVVKQGPTRPSWEDPKKEYPIKHRCQFSWYCDGKSDIPKNEKAWKKAQDYAYLVLYNRIAIDVTEGATHYHATYVKPSWAKTKTRTTRIESHIFYRWEK